MGDMHLISGSHRLSPPRPRWQDGRGTVRRAGLLTLAAVVLMLVPGGPAWAHNALAEATPTKNSVLKKAPAAVKLRFLQKLDPNDTTITVTDAGGQAVAVSDSAVDGATGSVTFADALANGEYQVVYRVVSRDGHKVQGSYRFTVAGPARTVSAAPPSNASSPSSAVPAGQAVTSAGPVVEKAAEATSGGVAAVLAVLGVVIVAAGAGAVVWRVRRRTPSS